VFLRRYERGRSFGSLNPESHSVRKGDSPFRANDSRVAQCLLEKEKGEPSGRVYSPCFVFHQLRTLAGCPLLKRAGEGACQDHFPSRLKTKRARKV
jgi:hypothetical protein